MFVLCGCLFDLLALWAVGLLLVVDCGACCCALCLLVAFVLLAYLLGLAQGFACSFGVVQMSFYCEYLRVALM